MSAELAPYALDPFGPSANPRAYVACEASERARAILERSLDEGRVAAVMGPPGYGKTLLLRLIGGREQDRARVAYVPFCTLDVDDLFAVVLNDLGVSRTGAPREVLVAVTRELAPRGGVVILVDDANALSDACATALAELYRELGGALRIALAAVQGPAAQRVFRAFGSAIDVVPLAGGMTGREARRYVETRLAYGGARPELVAAFDEATIDALHRASQGVPRRLNQAAESVVWRATRGSLPRLRERAGLAAQRATAAPVAATRPIAPAPPLAAPPPSMAPLVAAPDPIAARLRAAAPPNRPRPTRPTAPTPPAPPRGQLPGGDDDAGVLLEEIFDREAREAGEAAGAYRIVRGMPLPGTPAVASARARKHPIVGASETLVGPNAASLARTRHPASLYARRDAPVAPAPDAPRASSRLPIQLIGVAGFAFGVALALMWMLGRDSAPPRVFIPVDRTPAAAQPVPPVPPKVAPPAAPLAPAPPSALPVQPGVSPVAPAPLPTAPVAPMRAPARIAVSINATPWAIVWVDGKEVGETPLAGVALVPGRHIFLARMPDGTTREQTIDIDAAHKAVVFE